MKIEVNAETLRMLCAPYFSYEACKALCDYIDAIVYPGQEAPSIGDLCTIYAEVPARYRDEYTEGEVIAELSNDNILVINY